MTINKIYSRNEREIETNTSLHPGKVLMAELKSRGIKKSDFAVQLGMRVSHFSELLHGKRHVSEDLALRLENLLHIEATYWMRIQTTYNLDKIRLEKTEPPLSIMAEESTVYKTESDKPEDNKIVLFQEKQIRRGWHENDWFYNLVDVIEILSESPQPTVYWSKLKKKMVKEEGVDQLFPIWKQLKFEASNGKFYTMDAANTEGVFRIIQSIPSPKAEPFKRWLAQVGMEVITKNQHTELHFDRLFDIHRLKS